MNSLGIMVHFQIRGMPIGQALAQVEFCEKKAGNFVQMVSW